MNILEIHIDDTAVRLRQEAVGRFANLRMDNKNLVLGTYALIEAKKRKKGTAAIAPEFAEAAKRSVPALEATGRRRIEASLIVWKLQHTVRRMPTTLFSNT